MTDRDIADQDSLLDPDDKDIEAPDIEAPDADALDQRTPADPAERARHRLEPSRSLEVNDWDALEQAKIVDLDDDY
jgi:hypothetical protein